MTEEAILKAARKKINDLLPVLGNGMSMNDLVDEVIKIMREAMQKARREALRGN